MTDERTRKTLELLDKQILALVEEYYALVAPTAAEIQESADLLSDDAGEADVLVDPGSVFGKYYLASEALITREMKEDMEEASND